MSSGSARLVLTMLRDPHGLLATVLLGNMIVNVAFYALSFLITLKLAEISTAAGALSGAIALLVVILLGEVSPAIECASLDEGYVDLAGCERLYGVWSAGPLGRLPFSNGLPGIYLRCEDSAVPPPERTPVPEPYRWIAAVALWIKRAVKARTGLNISVGCASNRLAAKSASGFAKPNGLALIEPGREADFFLRLPLEDILTGYELMRSGEALKVLIYPGGVSGGAG